MCHKTRLAQVTIWEDTPMVRRQAWLMVILVTLLIGGSVVGCSYGGSSAPSVAPTVRTSPASVSGAQARVIELELTAGLRITHEGQPVTVLDVTPGEVVRFVVTNTASFDHDFYIGPDDRLAANQVEGLPGLPTWRDGTARELEWAVPEDAAELSFGCTLPGHYSSMNGTFATSEPAPRDAAPSP
jgi:uncharacterized cupredoxin-like copper-binding protein